MPHNFILGFSYIFSGMSLIRKKGIRRFVFQQFSTLMAYFLGGMSWLLDWLETGLESALPVSRISTSPFIGNTKFKNSAQAIISAKTDLLKQQ